jgi:hypothetical protein
VLTICVHPANRHDRAGVKLLLPPPIHHAFPRLRHLFADQGYNQGDRGRGKTWIELDRAHRGLDRRVGHTPVSTPRCLGLPCPSNRLGSHPAPAWFSSASPALGRATAQRRDWTLPPDAQGLGVSPGEQRVDGLAGHDPPRAQAADTRPGIKPSRTRS